VHALNTTGKVHLFFAIFFVLCAFWIARGLLPNAKPQFWSKRSTGLANVRLSRFSVISMLCAYLGFAIVFAGSAFERNGCISVGFGVVIIAFIMSAVSQSRDVRRARSQRLPPGFLDTV
jgi:hypothetical protein